ncbi:ABC transporter permease subunit [Mesorhizobium sp. B4-1-4]|uniref:ABC transporter permease subunit n=1 Tax=Mesorhizobium sp. B4-1-4 TaxID=2589888 RepID=UPI0015E27BCE|nr:ABC transporter permease subunit [Mesorhizobium sp. B4-1-4]UCI34643.1 ABC transporter permease subunit [Mesorhizobium sp. B4-1-4]
MATLLGNRRHRDQALQAAFVAVIGAIVVTGILTARRNMQIQGVTFGWDFLDYATGSTIPFTLIDYDISSTYARALLVGFVNTLLLGAISISLSFILGMLIGTARLASNKMLRWIASWYVQLFRNLPLILQAFFWYSLISHLPPPRTAIALPGSIFISNRGVFLPALNIDAMHVVMGLAAVLAFLLAALPLSRRYGKAAFGVAVAIGLALAALSFALGRQVDAPLLSLPQLQGLRFRGGGTIVPELTAVIIAISLFGASYVAEIVRGGFLAIPTGQTEAAQALGLRNWQIFSRIRLPLMIRIVLPTMTNQIIWLMKATTIGIAIGYTDFFAVVANSINHSGQTLTLIFILILGFWAINMSISVVMNAINRAIALPGHKK